jgi:hypothetical protein
VEAPIPSAAAQEKCYRTIVDALFKSVPEDWNEIHLSIEASESGEIQLSIFGPSSTPNLRVPDDLLYEAVFVLYDLFAQEARPFTLCNFRLWWNDELHSWKYSANYRYGSTI